jgi:hypothetical protein
MIKQRLPEIGEKVAQDGIEYKVEQECMGLYYGRKKFARELTQLNLDQIIYLTEPKKKKVKEKPPVKLTREERGQILRDLVEPDSLRDNFKREIMVLAKLVRKFPHREFLLEGFKPAIKVKSLLYWIDRQEVEDLYKKWAINLETKREEIKLEKEKIGEDIHLTTSRKPRNLLDLLK